MKLDLGNAWAITMVEAPCPQPMSATRAPRFRRSTTPSRAGSHSLTRCARYPVRKKLSVPQNMRWLCPCQPRPSPERKVSLVFVEPERGGDLESRRHENGTLVEHQDHRLRRRQGVSLLLGIVGDIAAGRLVGQPLADIALANAGRFGERHRRTGAEVDHRLIQAELAAHIDQHAGKSGAQVGNDLADEGFDLARRGRWCKLGHDPVPLRSHGTAGRPYSVPLEVVGKGKAV